MLARDVISAHKGLKKRDLIKRSCSAIVIIKLILDKENLNQVKKKKLSKLLYFNALYQIETKILRTNIFHFLYFNIFVIIYSVIKLVQLFRSPPTFFIYFFHQKREEKKNFSRLSVPDKIQSSNIPFS